MELDGVEGVSEGEYLAEEGGKGEEEEEEGYTQHGETISIVPVNSNMPIYTLQHT